MYLKNRAAGFSTTLKTIYQTTWHHISDDNNQVLKVQVPYKAGNFLTSWAIAFSLLCGIKKILISLINDKRHHKIPMQCLLNSKVKEAELWSHSQITNTRTKYVLEWSQGKIRWFIMNEKQQIIFYMIMMCEQSLINERVARHLKQGRGVTWHVVARIPKFCAEFSSISLLLQLLTTCSMYVNVKTQLYLLVVYWTFATLGTSTCFGPVCWPSSGCTWRLIQWLYRYMWVIYRGLGGGCVGARSRSGQIRVCCSRYSTEPS